MKNFKRVISAVIALAISASTLVAVSANKFADVDNTNSYAEAIEVLSALDIVHGYEADGAFTFKPDGDITRAEAATMIVGALNMTKEADAAAGTSKFTDVNEQASWASGYVNVGVAQGFISGFPDGSFAPQKNVTYAQMCVMLTEITGYGDYATAYGGYPTGYTTMAASAGINKGVALDNDANMKRGQVAQMIYNALTAPLLGVKAYNLSGNDYAIQDGTDLAFKTLLSDKFEGYEVDVMIDAVSKSDDSLNKGEIKVKQTKKAYLEQKKGEKDTNYAFGTVIDEAGVDDMLSVSGKAIMTKDANDKWHLVYFKASDLDKEVANAADYVKVANGGKDVAKGKITFGSKAYNVKDGGKIFVNGKEYGTLNQANVEALLPKAQGEVTLIDTTPNDSDSSYDKMMLTIYDVAKVTSVVKAVDSTTIQVQPKAGAAIHTGVTGLVFDDDDIADGDIDLTVKNAAGEDVALSSIKRDDIIAYAIPYDDTDITGDYEPSVIDIRVTDEKISGKVTREDPTAETYTVADTAYKMSAWVDKSFKVGTSYTFMLDPFGRIFDYDEVSQTNYKYAIANRVENGNEVQLILADGTSKYYEVSASKVVYNKTNEMTIGTFESYLKGEGTPKADPAKKGTDRVVKYTVKNSTGKIDYIELIELKSFINDGDAQEYREGTNKLGSYTISDITAVIDVQKVAALRDATSNYKKFSNSNFKDKEKYNFAIYVDKDYDAAVFALITKAGNDIGEDTRFAVVKNTSTSMDNNGDNVLSLPVLYKGEEKNFLCTLNSGVDALNPGDAFFYKTDSEGYVDTIKVVYHADQAVATAADIAINTLASKFSIDQTKWTNDLDPANKEDYQLVYGIVTNVTSRSIEFSIPGIETIPAAPNYSWDVDGDGNNDAWNLNDAEYDINGDGLGDGGHKVIDIRTSEKIKSFGITADCENYRFAKGSVGTATNTAYKYVNIAAPTASVLDDYITARNSSLYDLNKEGTNKKGADRLTYAMALIVNGDVVEIYTITQ